MRPPLRQALAAIATLAALSGCGTVVQRIEPGEVRDLSGTWNDTDSRLVSEGMVRDLRGWVEGYRLANRRAPTLVVGEVRSLAEERIGVEAFIGDIERALADSRRVTFVASGEERAGARAERKDQDFHAAGATRKPMGRELGADYMLTGTISASVDRSDWSEVRYYQVDLALIDLADNAKVWLGQKKIKKSGAPAAAVGCGDARGAGALAAALRLRRDRRRNREGFAAHPLGVHEARPLHLPLLSAEGT